MPSTRISKQLEDSVARIEALLLSGERDIARSFLDILNTIRDNTTEEQLASLIEVGDLVQINSLLQPISFGLAAFLISLYVRSGQDTARFINANIESIVAFDQSAIGSVTFMQNTRNRIVTEFMQRQSEAVRAVIIDGIARGLNPIEQGRQLRSVIGLTPDQIQIIGNYRRLLETNSRRALNRRLRDRRFDSTINNAIDQGIPIPPAQIDRIVDRYTSRLINLRANVIARTEALAVVHQGVDEMYQQSIDAGILDANELVNEWFTSRDEKVRTSHASMNGQRRGIGESFVTGSGNFLRFPGDPRAPINERAFCRCIKTVQFR
ncbi:MAG: phage head morphogenesis protein [Gammaproteobacteria bacterium]|nr:phage head morphogenesis protein [Gammaproteobacteria bacterium]